MTKQEYLESKGLKIYGHNLLEEVTYEFQDTIDVLAENFEDIYNENEDSEV